MESIIENTIWIAKRVFWILVTGVVLGLIAIFSSCTATQITQPCPQNPVIDSSGKTFIVLDVNKKKAIIISKK